MLPLFFISGRIMLNEGWFAFSSVHVVGPGALGLGLAVELASRGVKVSVVGPTGFWVNGEACVAGRWRSVEFASRPEQGCLAVIAVKGPDMKTASSTLANTGCAAALLLRNGLAPLPDLPCPAADGIVWACASRVARGALWRGAIAVDILHTPLGHEVARLLHGANVAARLVSDIDRVRFRKLMINAGINPLSALWRCDCRTLATHSGAVAEATAVAAEVKALAAASGVAIEDEPAALVASVLVEMDDFTPSMEQDRAAGRMLETEAIINTPLRLAAELGVKMPVLESLQARLLDKIT